MEVRHLVEKVKAAQKTGELVRSQWRDYCDTFGHGTRDPSKHSAKFLLRFFEMQSSGNIPVCEQPLHKRQMPGPDCDPSTAFAVLVAKVNYGRQASRQFKTAWQSFCANSATGAVNPECYEADALYGFLTSCLTGKGCFLDKNPYAAPPRFDGSPLAETVKYMQSSRLTWKHKWDRFSDAEGGGVRDPARHPAEFLQRFIDSVAPTCAQGREISRVAKKRGARSTGNSPRPLATRQEVNDNQRHSLCTLAKPFAGKDHVCTDWLPLESRPSIDATIASNDDTASTHTYDGSSSSGCPSSRPRSHSHPPRARSIESASAPSPGIFGLPPGYRVRNTFIEMQDISFSGL